MSFKIDTTIQELSKYSLFIGTPMYGGQAKSEYITSMTELTRFCVQNGIQFQTFYTTKESLVQRARNYIADAFMRSGMTHLLFIDADIGFTVQDVLTLLAIQVTNPDEYQVIGGVYPTKSIDWDKVVNYSAISKEAGVNLNDVATNYVFNTLEGNPVCQVNEPQRVSATGTGFMIIPKNVLTSYFEKYTMYRYLPDHLNIEEFNGTREITAFFHCEIDPVSRRYLSEDYFFCHKVREMGMNVHIVPWLELTHVGDHSFKGSLVKESILQNLMKENN